MGRNHVAEINPFITSFCNQDSSNLLNFFHQFVNPMIMYMDHLVLRFARLQVKNIDNFVHIYMKVITFT